MSVLIKGMEIPKSCLNCFVPCSLVCDLDDYDRKRIRHPECPCVEISTPHGDLTKWLSERIEDIITEYALAVIDAEHC